HPTATAKAFCCGQSGALLDDLVSAFEQWPRHHQASRFRGLEIDHQLVLGGRLHGQVSRLFALEDTIDVRGRISKLVVEVWSIRKQTTFGGEEALKVNGGQFVPASESDDELAIDGR